VTRVRVIKKMTLQYNGEGHTPATGPFEMDPKSAAVFVEAGRVEVVEEDPPDCGEELPGPAMLGPPDLEPDWPPPKAEEPSLKDLPSATPASIEILEVNGYQTPADLLAVDIKELLGLRAHPKTKKLGSRRASRLVEDAQNLLKRG